MSMTFGIEAAATSQGVEVPEYPLGEETVTSTLKSDSDAGYVITRRKYTRVLHKWTLKWTHLSGAHYAIVKAHYEAVGGAAGGWYWIHPQTGTIYHVRFKDDSLKFDLSVPGPESAEDANDGGYYSGSFVLEEV
mgnify:CR=1 FL=1